MAYEAGQTRTVVDLAAYQPLENGQANAHLPPRMSLGMHAGARRAFKSCMAEASFPGHADRLRFAPFPSQVHQQSIHSVRLQQICPARKRRRFLRRRAPAAQGSTFIHKNAILIISARAQHAPL